MANSDNATSSYSSESESEHNQKLNFSRRKRFQKLSEERRQCKEIFIKLQHLVNAREGLSQLELLQLIIDYISDLQEEVDKFDSQVTENKENYMPSQLLSSGSVRNCAAVEAGEEVTRAPQAISG